MIYELNQRNVYFIKTKWNSSDIEKKYKKLKWNQLKYKKSLIGLHQRTLKKFKDSWDLLISIGNLRKSIRRYYTF